VLENPLLVLAVLILFEIEGEKKKEKKEGRPIVGRILGQLKNKKKEEKRKKYSRHWGPWCHSWPAWPGSHPQQRGTPQALR
jgi:hypothetical protein